jgi:hypothetical protein
MGDLGDGPDCDPHLQLCVHYSSGEDEVEDLWLYRARWRYRLDKKGASQHPMLYHRAVAASPHQHRAFDKQNG